MGDIYNLQRRLKIDRFVRVMDDKYYDHLQQGEVPASEAMTILRGLARGTVSTDFHSTQSTASLQQKPYTPDALETAKTQAFVHKYHPNSWNNPLVGAAQY